MTLQQLEYIIAVYRLRHFAKAAEHCGVTQPTLSAMVQKLETELGVKLFERSSQQVVPTPVGRLVVEQAWKVVQRASRIKQIVAEEQQSVAGVFRMGILPTIAPYLLPRFFPRFCRKYPEVDIKAVELKTTDIKRALAKGEIDAAIMVDLDDNDNLELYPLYRERFYVYVSRQDPLFMHTTVKTADLGNKTLWLLDEGHCFRDQLVKFCNLKGARKSKAAYSLGSIETFMRMVEGGMGITFIPELALSQLSPQQMELVRPFALPEPSREIVLVTGKNYLRHTLIQLLVKEIQSNLPEMKKSSYRC